MVSYVLVHSRNWGRDLVADPMPKMRTPVARGSKVPPWPILTCEAFLMSLRRANSLPDSLMRFATSESINGLKKLEGLNACWHSRMTCAELWPQGLLMAKSDHVNTMIKREQS